MMRTWILGLIPTGLIIMLIAVFMIYRPLDFVVGETPPAESLTVERVTLDKAGIHVFIRAQGPAPIKIAQVQVDGAYRSFTRSKNQPLDNLYSTRLDISYPWVDGETHHLTFVTATGTAFEHTIDIAIATPVKSSSTIYGLALIGLFIGLVPVSLGLAFYPLMRKFSANTMQFILALTVGLLIYLLVDTIREGLEIAATAAPGFRADILMWVGLATAFLILMGVSRRHGTAPTGVALAVFISLGIGLHNLGEGIVVGASIATGKVSLATFLILGFALHNLTEGIAIAAPITGKKVSLYVLAGLAALAGMPAIVGTLFGAFVFLPHWAALAFGIGAGAILQVILEIGNFLYKTLSKAHKTIFAPATWTGLISGLGIMYLTSLLIQT